MPRPRQPCQDALEDPARATWRQRFAAAHCVCEAGERDLEAFLADEDFVRRGEELVRQAGDGAMHGVEVGFQSDVGGAAPAAQPANAARQQRRRGQRKLEMLAGGLGLANECQAGLADAREAGEPAAVGVPLLGLRVRAPAAAALRTEGAPPPRGHVLLPVALGVQLRPDGVDVLECPLELLDVDDILAQGREEHRCGPKRPRAATQD
mmetsp:Transcript_25428/g.73403  ORF Transcript_25428/g.73403 Transcript_25428/m.73403 type:complete len:208 (-) Transcript_25428:30-653(-)